MNEEEKLEKRRAYDRKWKRQYKLKHPEKVKQKRRERYYKEKQDPEKWKKHQEYMRAYNKKWGKNNPKRQAYRREWMREWSRKNAKEIYRKRRLKPYSRIASSMRTRVRECIKKGYKSAKTEELLGITIKELKIYLEKQFKEGMTWENYGFYGWHIDHTRPLSSFDLTKSEEQKKAFHYTNLQPLWAKENLTKHSKILN